MTISKSIALTTSFAALSLFAVGLATADGQLYAAAALAVFAIGLYATGAIPAYVTAVWFFLLAVVGGVAPPEVVFSGFASMGFWMVFGGLLIGIAVHETGLARRAANAMAHGFGRSYFGNVAGIVGVGLAFAFIIPSTMGRVVVLMPIVLKLAENHGFEAGSNGRNGFVIALVFGTLLPAFALLPSNLPNIILTGAADSLFAITLNYGEYLVLHFPILGLLKAVLMIVLIVVLFGETPRGQAQTVASTPLSSDERRLTVILAATLVLWMTDTVHGIAPGWISLAAGSACLLPRLGVLRPSLVESMNYGALLYVAGIIGLGATIAASGLGDRLGSLLLDVIGFAPGEDARNLGAMTAVSMAVGLTATQASIPAILTPLSDGVAAAMGLPLATVLMMQVLGFSSVVFPYQVPPLMVGLSLGGVSVATATRFSLFLLLPTLLVLLPLDYLWWRMLGYLG